MPLYLKKAPRRREIRNELQKKSRRSQKIIQVPELPLKACQCLKCHRKALQEETRSSLKKQLTKWWHQPGKWTARRIRWRKQWPRSSLTRRLHPIANKRTSGRYASSTQTVLKLPRAVNRHNYGANQAWTVTKMSKFLSISLWLQARHRILVCRSTRALFPTNALLCNDR